MKRDRRACVRRSGRPQLLALATWLVLVLAAPFISASPVAPAAPEDPAFGLRSQLERNPAGYAEAVRQARLSLTDRGLASEAVALVEAARAAAQSAGSFVSESQQSLLMFELAQAYKSAGRYRDAERAAKEVVDRVRAQVVAKPPALSAALRAWADMLRASGDLRGALEALGEAEQALQKEGGAEGGTLAGILSESAELRMSTGDLDGALADGEAALAMQRAALPDPHVEITGSIHILARIYRFRGDPARAIPLFEEALAAIAVLRPPLHPDTAAIANNYGLLLLSTGDFERARALFQRSLEARMHTFGADHPETATGLNNLALLHWTIGAHGEAARMFERVLAIDMRMLGDSHPFVATTIHNIGSVLAAQGNLEAARQSLERALLIRQRALGPGHPLVANSLERLGTLLMQTEDAIGAEKRYLAASAILSEQHGPDNPEAANIRVQLAAALVSQGRFDEAVEVLNRSLGLSERSRALNTVWRGYHTMARAWSGKAQPALAIYWVKESIAVLQSLRQGLAGFDRSIQRGFAAERRHVYVEAADWLVDAGRIAEAQDILRLLKEEEYFDFILRDTKLPLGAPVIFSGAAENEAYRQLRTLRALLERLSSEIAVAERLLRTTDSQEVRARLATSRANLTQAHQQYESFLAVLSRRFAEAIGSTRVMPAAVRMPAGILRVQYLVGEKSVLVVASTAAGTTVHRAAVSAAQLARLVAAHRRSIAAREPAVVEGRRLFDLLMAPVLATLRTQRLDSLEVSADGVLRYVPFAALHDGRGYLIERIDVAARLELSSAAANASSVVDSTLEAFGLTKQVAGFPALPGVRTEVERIGRTAKRSNIQFDEAFTRDALEQALKRKPSILHIASHFKFRPGTELDSYLVLGNGDRMSLRDFRNLPAALGNIDLITLSACETALGGGRDDTGREVDGLAATLHARGARTVVASLWPVEDNSTAGLLPEMYGLHLNGGFTVMQALARAQRGQIGRGVGSEPTRPFYWAAFTVIGSTP